MKKNFLIGLIVLAISILNTNVTDAMVVISTFDIDDEEWTATQDELTIVHQSTGGNPGGFLSVEDLYWAVTGVAFPPSKFKGDLSEFEGGLLTYDLLLIHQPTTPIPPNTQIDSGFGRIQLHGGGSNATFDYVHYPPIPSPLYPSPLYWTTYYVPMTAEAWHTTQDNWARVLSDVSYCSIILDIGGQGIIGLDNFKIEPIPEPSSLILLSFGLLGASLFKRKRRR